MLEAGIVAQWVWSLPAKQHLIWTPIPVLHFWTSSLLMRLGRMDPTWRPAWSSRLLASAWSHPGCCDHLRSELLHRRFLSVTSLCNSVSQTNIKLPGGNICLSLPHMREMLHLLTLWSWAIQLPELWARFPVCTFPYPGQQPQRTVSVSFLLPLHGAEPFHEI